MITGTEGPPETIHSALIRSIKGQEDVARIILESMGPFFFHLRDMIGSKTKGTPAKIHSYRSEKFPDRPTQMSWNEARGLMKDLQLYGLAEQHLSDSDVWRIHLDPAFRIAYFIHQKAICIRNISEYNVAISHIEAEDKIQKEAIAELEKEVNQDAKIPKQTTRKPKNRKTRKKGPKDSPTPPDQAI